MFEERPRPPRQVLAEAGLGSRRRAYLYSSPLLGRAASCALFREGLWSALSPGLAFGLSSRATSCAKSSPQKERSSSAKSSLSLPRGALGCSRPGSGFWAFFSSHSFWLAGKKRVSFASWEKVPHLSASHLGSRGMLRACCDLALGESGDRSRVPGP